MLNTLYVTNPDARLKKQDDAISVCVDDKKIMNVPFHLLGSIVLVGHVGCTTSLLAACASHGVTVVFLDERGRYQARVEGAVSGNILLRREQYRRAMNDNDCLTLAKRFVAAKMHNQRIMLQHYTRDYPEIGQLGVADAVTALKQSRVAVVNASSLDELRGIEGRAARTYYSVFGLLLRNPEEGVVFGGRSRRPPRGCVNAALSFFYTMMSRDIASACEAVGARSSDGLSTCVQAR